jgi:hypothetical protein
MLARCEKYENARTTEMVCSRVRIFQHAVEFLGGAGVGLAAEAHGGLPDGFDDGVDFLALLVAQHVAEQAPEQADVFLQRRVLVGVHAGLFS